MISDDEKAKFGVYPSNDNGREWHISYYNHWHCKQCDEKLIRWCDGCNKEFDKHSFEEWIQCSDAELSKKCPKGCEDHAYPETSWG